MKSAHVLAICVVAALLLGSTSFTEAAVGEYDYSTGPLGQANWGNLPGSAACSTGTMQSPMNITAANMFTDKSLPEKLLTTVPIGKIPANISNDGKSIEVTLKGLTVKIDGRTYESAQFHLHYPSEHVILNFQFALELHLVHIEPATGKIAVIAWLFVLGPDNEFLNQFFNNLPAKDEKNVPIPGGIDPPKVTGTYGRYMGSLTTPPCSEGVVWTLNLWDFPTVSVAQLEQLKMKLPMANARDVQPAYNRNLLINT